MTKKFFLLMLSALLILWLGACNRNGDEEPDPVPDPLAPPQSAIPAPAPTPTPAISTPVGIPIPKFDPNQRSQVEVEFWHVMTGANQEIIQRIVNDFNNAQPYVLVNEMSHGDYGQLASFIMLSDLAGRLPHLAQAEVADVTHYRAERMILPLSPFMNDPVVGMTRDDIGNIVQGFRATSAYDGTWYSIPFAKSLRALFYNRSLLGAHDFAAPPATWNELMSAAQAMANPVTRRAGFGFENAFDMEWVALLLQRGGSYIDEGANRAVFASMDGIAAMDLIMNVINSPYVRVAGNNASMPDMFARQEVAMYIGSSIDISHVNNAVGDAFEWGAAPVPSFWGNAATEITGSELVMFENTSHSIDERVGAWEFMAYFLRPEIQAWWTIASGHLPATHTSASLPGFTRYLNEHPPVQAVVNMLDDGFFRTRVVQAGAIRNILLHEIGEIMAGRITSAEGLLRAQDRANAILAE